MQAFIVVVFFAAAANAASLGYGYGPGLSGENVITKAQLVGGSSFGIGNINSGIASLGGGGSSLVSSQSNLVGGGIHSVGGDGGTTVVGIDAVDSVPQTVEYNKQVFYFSAPDEEQNEGHVSQQLSNILKKNLQVVFIKAPENNAATNAALQLAKQAIEQNTAIYLLSKENDGSHLIGQLQQIQENVPTVPEVRIIKYRTDDDLINAQASIQAQYDNIGGYSPLINGGVVPVLNYASGVGSVSGGFRGGFGGAHGIGGGIGSISLGGASYGPGYSQIVGGRSNSGSGFTKFIGGGITSTGGYLPPLVRK